MAGRLSSKQKKELLKEVRAARKNLAKQMASEAGITEKQANQIIKQMGEVGQKVSDTLIANTEQQIRDTLPLSQQLAAFTDASSPEDDPYGSVLSDAADELDRIAKELCDDVVDCVGAFLNGKDTGDYSEYYMFVRKIVDFKSEKEFINAQMKMLKANFPNNKSLGKVEKQAEALLRFNRVLAKMFNPLVENKHSAAFSLLQNAVAYNEHLIALRSRINKNLVGGDVDIDLGTPVPEDAITDLDEIVVGMTLISPRQIKAIYLLDETGLTEKSVSKVDFEALARSFAMQAYDNLWEAGSPAMWTPDMVAGDFRRDVEAEIEVIAMRQAKRMLASYKERGMTELGRVSDNVIAFTSDSAAYLRDEYVVPGTKAALSAAKAGVAAAASVGAAAKAGVEKLKSRPSPSPLTESVTTVQEKVEERPRIGIPEDPVGSSAAEEFARAEIALRLQAQIDQAEEDILRITAEAQDDDYLEATYGTLLESSPQEVRDAESDRLREATERRQDAIDKAEEMGLILRNPRLNPTPRGNPTYSSTWKGRFDEIYRTEAEARAVAKMFNAMGGQYRVVPHEGGFHVSDAEEDALWAAGEHPQQEEILEQRERMRKEDLAAGFPVAYNPGGVRWYA